MALKNFFLASRKRILPIMVVKDAQVVLFLVFFALICCVLMGSVLEINKLGEIECDVKLGK